MDWLKNLISKKEPTVAEVAKEQRRSFRVKITYSVTLVAPPNAFPGYVTDFSQHGCRVMSNDPLKVGGVATVILRGKAGQEIELKGKVIWCRKFKGDNEYSSGLEYIEFKNIKSFGDLVDFVRREKHLETM